MYIEGISPFIFRIGGFGIRWYGFMLAISMAVGVYYLITEGKGRGYDEDGLYTLALYAIIAGILGARLLYVLTNWSDYVRYPIEIIRIDHGGLSWHGAVGGGALAAWWYARRHELPFAVMADLTVPGLAVGYMLVRLANIANQEVLGRYATILGTRHPTQIYGSLIGLGLLVNYFLQRRRRLPAGYLFWSFFLWYSVLRGVIEETFRANPLYVWGYVNQYLGAGFFTLTHVFTPLLVLFSWYMMKRSLRAGRAGFSALEEENQVSQSEEISHSTG